MADDRPVILALQSGVAIASEIAEQLDATVVPVEERGFSDGEFKIRPLDEVRGRHAVIVQSLDGGPEGAVAERLLRTLFLIGAVRDAGAARITGAFPYLAFARKDRRTKPRDPLSLRYLAKMFEAVGVDEVMAFEVHDLPAFENAFRVPTVPLDARRLFIEQIVGELGEREIVVVSPDPGGIKRAQLFQEMLARRLERPVDRVVADKRRSGGEVSGEALYGEVRGKSPVIVDDLISSGGTICRAAQALVEAGAEPAIVVAAHGVFSADAAAKLAAAPIRRLLVTDSVQPVRLSATDLAPLEIVGCAALFAGAIECLVEGGSISALLGD